MKKTIKILLFLLAGILITGSIPSHYLTASPLTELMTIPLQNEYWAGTGKINFEIDPQTQKPYIEWKPLKKNSFLVCRLPFSNIHSFNHLEIELNSLKPSNAWFFIYLHDNHHRSAMTYFQLEGNTSYQLELSFQILFSSFAYDKNFDWNQVQSLSFLSHPSANLSIHQTHLQIKNIKWSRQDKLQSDFELPLNQPVTAPVLLNHLLWNNIKKEIGNHPDETLREALRRINRSSIQARINKNPSLEVLRNAAIGLELLDIELTLSELIEKTMSYDALYWKELYLQNDILVQEEALYFLQIYEILIPFIMQNDKYLQFFAEIMKCIAEIQQETMLYWIDFYPFGQGNNHVTRPACILGIIALLYPYESPMRNEWINFSLHVLNYYIDFQISTEGVLNEGTHYYVYLMETLSYFAYYLSATVDLNIFYDFPFSEKLQKMVKWTHLIETPQGYLPCIDDSWPTGVVFPKKYLKPFFEQDKQDYFWYHNQEPWNLLKGSYFPLYLINAVSTSPDPSKKNLPSHNAFISDSQVAFRVNGNNNSYYLFISGKNMFSLHEHDSAGTFQYFINDYPLMTVSGYGPKGWASKHREYYVSGEAHNTFMIEGYAPKGFYNGGTGPIDTTVLESWQDKAQASYAHLNIGWDIRFPEVSHLRHWVMLPDYGEINGSLIIFDQLLSPSHRSYQANLHPTGEILFQNQNQLFFKTMDTSKNNVARIFHNQPWERIIQSGYHSDYWGKEHEKKYIQLLNHDSNTFLATHIQPLTCPIDPGVIETHHNHSFADEFIIQHTLSEPLEDLFHINPYRLIHQTSRMGSNASFSHIRHNQKEMRVEQCYLKEGTFLNFGNKNIIHAQSPLTLSYSRDSHQNIYNMTYQSVHEKVKIFFYNTQVQEIIWNDQLLSFERFNDRISFILPKGYHMLQLRYDPGKE